MCGLAALGCGLNRSTQQGLRLLLGRNRTSVSCRCPLRMLAECSWGIRLRRPVLIAITFPVCAQAVIDQALGMPAVMRFGPDAGREVRCENHAGRIARRLAHDVGYIRRVYAEMDLRRINPSSPGADYNSENSLSFVQSNSPVVGSRKSSGVNGRPVMRTKYSNTSGLTSSGTDTHFMVIVSLPGINR